jgi:hypothetical protein
MALVGDCGTPKYTRSIKPKKIHLASLQLEANTPNTSDCPIINLTTISSSSTS